MSNPLMKNRFESFFPTIYDNPAVWAVAVMNFSQGKSLETHFSELQTHFNSDTFISSETEQQLGVFFKKII